MEKGSPLVVLGSSKRFPSWLHRPLPDGKELFQTEDNIRKARLHTVCEEARCPNLVECYSKKTATFLVLGRECTRACGFCDIAHAKKPVMPDLDEPERVALAALELGLRHVVITMVARDDLNDGGAAHLVACIEAVRKSNATVEVLTSDFMGVHSSWDTVFRASPDIFNHNVETVERLTPKVRHTATYARSLELLAYAKKNQMRVKSGLMVGLGEARDEVVSTLKDLASHGCDIVTIGQYLKPSRKKFLVQEFIHPDQFKEYEAIGKELGIKHMFCGPFVRSSYNAGIFIEKTGQIIDST